MTGELTEKSSDSGAGEGCMGLLKTLRREEILEVLSEGFCRQCHPLLEDRIRRIHNSKKTIFFLSFFPLFDSFSFSFGLF
jgi:hypothetical protein